MLELPNLINWVCIPHIIKNQLKVKQFYLSYQIFGQSMTKIANNFAACVKFVRNEQDF